MNLGDTIRAFEIKQLAAADRQKAIMQLSATEGRTLEDEEESEYDALTTELAAVEKHLGRLHAMEAAEAATATAVTTTVKGVEQVRGAPRILVRKTDKDDDFQGQSFVRRVIAKAIAHLEGYERPAWMIANERWGKTNPTLVAVIKAAVAGGGTGTGEWGAELVTADSRYTGDFIEFLNKRTVFDRLALREIPPHVTIKGQDGAATANWVGESKSIPATTVDFMNVTLTPLKVAAISVVSNELLKYSSPAAEALVRDALVNAAAQRIDMTFLSAAAAVPGVSPAGILNGLTSLGSNGFTAEALRSDIKELYAPFIGAMNATGLVIVTTPSIAKSMSLMVNALGQSEFAGLNADGGTLLGDTVITGDNVPAGMMILLKPSDIYKIGDTGVEVSVSRDATIEQDSAPTGESDTPVAASATIMSMFGTESTAFKVVRPISFAKRRASAAAFIGDANYGNAGSTTA